MIWALQRLANLQEQGKVEFSLKYLNSVQASGDPHWRMYLVVDGQVHTPAASTAEIVAQKAVDIAEAQLKEERGRAEGRGHGETDALGSP